MNMDEIRGALGVAPQQSRHAAAILKAMEEAPCTRCGGARERAFRASAECVTCMRELHVADGLDASAFDAKMAEIRAQAVHG